MRSGMRMQLKLIIFIIVVFGFTILGMILWRPIKIIYYSRILHNGNKKTRQRAISALFDMNAKEPLMEFFIGRYFSKNTSERFDVLDELCLKDDRGKLLFCEIFKKHCINNQVKIPGGSLMLSNGTEVMIKDFYIDKYEVTIERYHVFQECSDFTISPKPWSTRFLSDSKGIVSYEYQLNNNTILLDFPEESNYPINNILFPDAEAYAEWLGMRLPTKYEWEYAARAGSAGKYCFGDNTSLLGEYAWYKENSMGKPHPIGKKSPNEWGLHDVHGNLNELCLPISGCRYLVRKGGSFYSNAFGCRLSENNSSNFDVGFRCVRDTN